MPNNLFNNWCIHESSTVYLKLLRYKLVTMFKEEKNKSMIICNDAAWKGGQNFCCIWKHFCVLVRRKTVLHLYAAIQCIAWRPPINSLGTSGDLQSKSTHSWFFVFRFFTPSDFNIAKYYLTKVFCCYCVMLFCFAISSLNFLPGIIMIHSMLCFALLFFFIGFVSFLFFSFLLFCCGTKNVKAVKGCSIFLWITF